MFSSAYYWSDSTMIRAMSHNVRQIHAPICHAWSLDINIRMWVLCDWHSKKCRQACFFPAVALIVPLYGVASRHIHSNRWRPSAVLFISKNEWNYRRAVNCLSICSTFHCLSGVCVAVVGCTLPYESVQVYHKLISEHNQIECIIDEGAQHFPSLFTPFASSCRRSWCSCVCVLCVRLYVAIHIEYEATTVKATTHHAYCINLFRYIWSQ